ncbi:MAG: hypothetical protein ACRD8O_06860 [Bryobacteraceae bacterium]
MTELTGEVTLNCTGGTPTPVGQQIQPVNVQVFLNTSVTSRLLTSSAVLGSQWSEAILLLDDPAPNNQYPCQTATGVCINFGDGNGGFGNPLYYGGGTTTPSASPQNKNVFQGQQVASNSVLWLGVPIDPPGSNRTRIIRLVNVRANANALGVAGPNSIPTPIVMSITATGSIVVPINNPQQQVASVQKGLQFTVNSGSNIAVTNTSTTLPQALQQCVTRSESAARFAILRYSELFASAFKRRNPGSSFANPSGVVSNAIVGLQNITETGFYNPLLVGDTANRGALGIAGLPDFGTRLKATFNNVPVGVRLFVDRCAGGAGCTGGVSTISVSGSTQITDTARATSPEAGTFADVAAASGTGVPASPANVVEVAITTGSGSVVWEVTDSDLVQNSFGVLSFGVYATYTANPGANSPALGTATVNGSYAPTSSVTTASNSAPIPRFADTSVASNIFSINPCITNLLYPFVTNQLGFDTGLAISNTSSDPFGTSTQAGTCTLNWFGANAPAATLTPNVAAGTTYVTLASSAAPNFQGYMIAVCRFQYAHGFAFVSDAGATRLAMGYLALIIPDRTRVADPFLTASSGSGEQLGY